HRQEDVKPLVGFALAHPEQAPMHDLEGRGFQVNQNEQQPIFRRRERAVLVYRQPAGGPACPIEAPRRHLRQERGLKGWDEGLKRVEGHAGAIQELRRAGLQVREPWTGHGWCLLASEVQDIIKRDKLYSVDNTLKPRCKTMQAYLNYPEVKNRIMRLIHEEHEGLPPIKLPSDLTIQIDIPGSAPITWPGAPASRGGLDYEGQLGIPMTVAVVAEAVWASAGAAYADTWPAR